MNLNDKDLIWVGLEATLKNKIADFNYIVANKQNATSEKFIESIPAMRMYLDDIEQVHTRLETEHRNEDIPF